MHAKGQALLGVVGIKAFDGKGRLRWCWVGGQGCSRTSGSVLECFIWKLRLNLCSLEPTLEVIVLQLIGARLGNLILGGGAKALVKLQDDCNGIHVT
jgi:hypothetical protein